jgi:YidC/Oxa1 family membrane protein insertase
LSEITDRIYRIYDRHYLIFSGLHYRLLWFSNRGFWSPIVKLILYPLTQKQYESMKDMQKIQPMMKKIQEKYKSDPQRMQTEQLALYKKYNVNPLGGCLPLLIQMPILIGIFMTIRSMAEAGRFIGESFLWIGSPLSQTYEWIADSLASPDVPLLLIYGVSMYLSQKMTVTDPSGAQTQKMMSIYDACHILYLFCGVFLHR